MTIEFFGNKGEYGFLSNFHNAIIEIEGTTWSSVEHFYQASKATNVEDRQRVACAEGPGSAKRVGRTIAVRGDWDSVVGDPSLHTLFSDEQGVVVEKVKDHFMYAALIAKFTQRRELRAALLRTGTQPLIEASPRDYYWGVGKERTGLNKLGRMLQLVRARLQST